METVALQIPNEFHLENLPEVKCQLGSSACIPFVISSIFEYHYQQKFSTNFIYGLQQFTCGQFNRGMSLDDACKILLHYGNLPYDDCPGNDEIPNCCIIAANILKNKDKRLKALNYKISNYFTCNSENEIKEAIIKYGPIILTLNWYKDCDINAKYIISFNTNSKKFNHAILVYGWNSLGWLVQNSWGNNFADNGRCIIPYTVKLLDNRVIIIDK